jgi:two-component system chemotaxis response regulator CheY
MGNGQPPPPTALIVDDSPTVRLHLRALLEEQGYRVAEAENGLEGLEEARQSPYQVIIADVNMPIMDGLEMIVGLRQLTSHKQTPIFVATTEVSEELVARGLAAGATAWLVKPIDATMLASALRSARLQTSLPT